LSSKFEDYEQKVNEINVLNGKVVELEKELQLAQTTIANQVCARTLRSINIWT
jgi:hypothetical protein